MKLNKITAALFMALFVASPAALAINEKGEGPNSSSVNSNNHANMRSSYEHSESGKARAEWSKGRVIKQGESVQCWNANLMRGGIKEKC